MANKSLARSALLITGLSLVSSVLALLVDAATAAYFGATAKMDAYLTASLIPNILAMTVPSTLSVVFVPVFHKISRERGEQEAWQVASRIFNALGLFLLLLAVGTFPLAEWIIQTTAPGFSSDNVVLAAKLYRWLVLSAVFIGLNAILSGFYNAVFQFGPPAFMPIVRNSLTLAGIILLTSYFDVAVLAYVAFIAAIVQFVCLAPVLLRGGRYVYSLSLNDPEIRNTLRLAFIMLVGGVAYSAYGVVDRYFGSSLSAGSISYLGYANKIGMFFSNIVSVGIGTVAFSRFSSQAASGDREALADDLVRVMSVITLVILPALAIVLALREPLLSLLFERNAFTAKDVVQTGYALVGYAGLLVVMGIGRPITLAFYSLRDTRTPVIINTVSLLFYIPLVYVLCVTLQTGYIGIAVATSVVHILNCGWYVLRLKKELPRLKLVKYFRYFNKIIGYSLLIAVTCVLSAAIIATLASDFMANVLTLLAGLIIWSVFLLLLYRSRDVYLLKVYEAFKTRIVSTNE